MRRPMAAAEVCIRTDFCQTVGSMVSWCLLGFSQVVSRDFSIFLGSFFLKGYEGFSKYYTKPHPHISFSKCSSKCETPRGSPKATTTTATATTNCYCYCYCCCCLVTSSSSQDYFLLLVLTLYTTTSCTSYTSYYHYICPRATQGPPFFRPSQFQDLHGHLVNLCQVRRVA